MYIYKACPKGRPYPNRVAIAAKKAELIKARITARIDRECHAEAVEISREIVREFLAKEPKIRKPKAVKIPKPARIPKVKVAKETPDKRVLDNEENREPKAPKIPKFFKMDFNLLTFGELFGFESIKA